MAIKGRNQRKKKKRTGNRSEYWQECGKKKQYGTPETAGYAIEKVRKEYGVECYWYRCKYCKKWHISSDD